MQLKKQNKLSMGQSKTSLNHSNDDFSSILYKSPWERFVDKAIITDELRRLERQQAIRETDIDVALEIMRDVDRQWVLASPGARTRFQSILFPQGLIYDYKNHRFGTGEISVFYRVLPTKKGSPEPEKPFLVAGVGFEPTTFWL